MPRLTVLLDLDETLVHAVTPGELGLTQFPEDPGKAGAPPPWAGFDGFKRAQELAPYRRFVVAGYLVFERPWLRPFLAELKRRYGRVGVWTAAGVDYATAVVKALGLRPDPFLTADHCAPHMGGPSKDLTFAARLLAAGASSPPRRRLVIVDDRPRVKAAQPSRCVQVKPFDGRGDPAVDEEQLRLVLDRLELMEQMAP